MSDDPPVDEYDEYADPLRVSLPPSFESDPDPAVVIATPKVTLTGRSQVDVFAEAQRWMATHDVVVLDVSWKHFDGEDAPYGLSIYFTVDWDPYADPEPDRS